MAPCSTTDAYPATMPGPRKAWATTTYGKPPALQGWVSFGATRGVEEDSQESLGTARRSNQSIPKEISSEYSLEGLMLKLKLQSFGHLLRRTDSLEKTLILGKIEGGRRRG